MVERVLEKLEANDEGSVESDEEIDVKKMLSKINLGVFIAIGLLVGLAFLMGMQVGYQKMGEICAERMAECLLFKLK